MEGTRTASETFGDYRQDTKNEILYSNITSDFNKYCINLKAFFNNNNDYPAMFKIIRLKNFRVFRDLEFDLSGPKDVPLKFAVIYGRNASGKTALVKSMEFLKVSAISYSVMTSATAMTDSDMAGRIWAYNGGTSIPCHDLGILARLNIMEGSDGPMELSFRFDVDGKDAEYGMVFSEKDGRLVSETLKYASAKGRKITYIHAEEVDGKPRIRLNRDPFPESDFSSWLIDQGRQWWGKHTLLSIVMYGALMRNRSFMDDFSPRLMTLVDSIDGFNSAMSGFGGRTGATVERDQFHGFIDSRDRHILDAYENALGRFLTRVDPDLDGVVYETAETNGRLEYSLCFDRYISGRIRRIRYGLESKGVTELVRLFPRILGCCRGRVAFVDELDSDIHDKLVLDLLDQILPDITGQLVMTTHNSSLLEELDPRCAFIIGIDADGDRSISPISSIARTCRNNNNRDRYMRGDLGGVPHLACIDMDNIVDHLREDIDGNRSCDHSAREVRGSAVPGAVHQIRRGRQHIQPRGRRMQHAISHLPVILSDEPFASEKALADRWKKLDYESGRIPNLGIFPVVDHDDDNRNALPYITGNLLRDVPLAHAVHPILNHPNMDAVMEEIGLGRPAGRKDDHYQRLANKLRGGGRLSRSTTASGTARTRTWRSSYTMS